MFKNKSVNLKIVDDKLTVEPSAPKDITQGILAAHAYAEVVRDTIVDVAGTVVTATVTIYVVKTICKVVDVGARSLFK